MIGCTVTEDRMGHLVVDLEDGSDVYLQSDYDRAKFAVDCGLIKAPDNWDGSPDNLPENWHEADFTSITFCPDYYLDIAEF